MTYVNAWRVMAMYALAVATTSAQAQLPAGDTEFWFAPPDVTDLHDVPGAEPIYVNCTSTGPAATLTVDQPANPAFAGGAPIVTMVPASGTVRVNLSAYKASLETRPTNTLANTGLHVQSTERVTCLYEIANTSNTEQWTLRGSQALGQEFYIPLHRHAPFGNETSFFAPHQAFASFEVVATQNNTVLSIYSPTALDGHAPLQQFSIMLNRGQTYSAGWTGTNWQQPATHPAGAVVIADKPVAVSIKDDSNHNPSGACIGLMGEQIVPAGLVGEEYIAVKGLLNNNGDESVLLMATRNGTQVFLDGASTPVATLFAGEPYRIDMDYLTASASNAIHVRASKPAYALHVTGNGCKMGMAMLAPLYRGGSRQVDVTRTSSLQYHLMITVPTAATGSFSAVGAGTAAIPASSFVVVPGTQGAWSAARVQLNTTQMPVDTRLQISNSLSHFMLNVLNSGSTSGARYVDIASFQAGGDLAVTTTRSPTTLPEPGGNASVDVRVTNTSAATATLTGLHDDVLADLDGRGNCTLPQSIAPGAFYQCFYPTPVTGNAGTSRMITVSASGTGIAGALNGSSAPLPVQISDVLPSGHAIKNATPTLVDAPGAPVTFSVRVDNDSSAEAANLVSLVDDVHGNLSGRGDCVLPQLLPIAGFYACSFTTLVSGVVGDVEVDTITAELRDDEANAVFPADSAVVMIGFGIFADGFE